MGTEVIPFSFESASSTIRVVEISGEPWFVAKDVADALEYAESSNASRLFAHVPDKWKGVNPIHTPGGIQVDTLRRPGVSWNLLRTYVVSARSARFSCFCTRHTLNGEASGIRKDPDDHRSLGAPTPPALRGDS